MACLAAWASVLLVSLAPLASAGQLGPVGGSEADSGRQGSAPSGEGGSSTGWPQAVREAARDLLPLEAGDQERAVYDSPRHVLATFVEAMDRLALGDEPAWERARGALPGASGELAGTDGRPAEPAGEAHEAGLRAAAVELKRVLDRLGEPDTLELPGRREVDEDRLRRYP